MTQHSCPCRCSFTTRSLMRVRLEWGLAVFVLLVFTFRFFRERGIVSFIQTKSIAKSGQSPSTISTTLTFRFQNYGPLADFVIAGVQKGGTTALLHSILECDGVFIHPREIRFPYGLKKNITKLPDRNYSAFERGFHVPPNLEKKLKRGRVSAGVDAKFGYKDPRHSDNPAELMRYNANMKVIFVLRHPIKRLVSWFNHFCVNSSPKPTCCTLLKGDINNLAGEGMPNPCWGSIKKGRYDRLIESFMAQFKQDNIKVLFSEVLKARQVQPSNEAQNGSFALKTSNKTQEGPLANILRFLGIPSKDMHCKSNNIQNLHVRSYSNMTIPLRADAARSIYEKHYALSMKNLFRIIDDHHRDGARKGASLHLFPSRKDIMHTKVLWDQINEEYNISDIY